MLRRLVSIRRRRPDELAGDGRVRRVEETPQPVVDVRNFSTIQAASPAGESLKNHDYQHVPVATETFSGKLLGVADVAEMAHQHLDAYLECVDLARRGVDTLKLFLG